MESLGVGTTSPPLPSLLRDQTQPGLFSREKEEAWEQSLESLGVGTTSPPLPSLLHDQTQPGLFSREKEEAGNKVWSPWASGQLSHPSPPCCVTRLNQGYSLVRRKKQEQSLESLGVGTTSPPLPFLLRDHTRPGLFSTRVPWASGELPHPSPPSREKEEAGNKVWSPWRRDNFPTSPLPAA